LTEEALRFIANMEGRPFFLNLSYYAVHTPLQAKEGGVERFERKDGSGRQNNPVYAAMVETVDQNIGRLLNRLEEWGIAENTLVAFTSDDGGVWNSTGMAPLRAGKGSYYEAGIRVPLIFRWSEKIEGGRVSAVPVNGVDLFPTFLSVAGAPQSGEKSKRRYPRSRILSTMRPMIK
jgi:arylsulfatase A-like enzyme